MRGLVGGLNGVIKVGRVKTSIGISMLEAGRHGVAGGNEKKRQRDWHLDVGGRAARGGRRQREEAATSVRSVGMGYAKAAWAEWAEHGPSGQRGKAGQHEHQRCYSWHHS
jgi:hypothetical protein